MFILLGIIACNRQTSVYQLWLKRMLPQQTVVTPATVYMKECRVLNF